MATDCNDANIYVPAVCTDMGNVTAYEDAHERYDSLTAQPEDSGAYYPAEPSYEHYHHQHGKQVGSGEHGMNWLTASDVYISMRSLLSMDHCIPTCVLSTVFIGSLPSYLDYP